MRRNKRFFVWLVYTVGILITVWLVVKLFFAAPLLSGVSFSRAYYDRDGKMLRITLSADDKYRIYTPLSAISPHLKNAVILYEDRHFYRHPGVNPIAILRALRQYVSNTPRPVGASTITMQVARMRYDLNSKTLGGKLLQIASAIYIDLFYSKDEILEAYLNLAPYGGNIEGIGAASTIYFGRHAADLSKIEAITLATIPQNPTKRGLNTVAGIENITKMRGNLVERWIDEYPNDTNLRTLREMPIAAHKVTDLPFLAPHFIDNLNTHKMPQKMSEIYTTLDMGLQKKLEKALQREINARRSVGITNAAAILVNYKTMETLAYIGSADYYNRDIYGENDGVRARRSPGSTLKPLIYATAADRGLIHGMTLLRDTRVNFGVYAPENSDSEFYGPILARDALTRSRNIPAINLLRDIGINEFYKIMVDSGISNLKSARHYGVSVALGGAEVSMFELSDIYATMANLGLRRGVKMLRDKDADKSTQILSPEAFFITLDMLSHQKAPMKKIPFTKDSRPILKHYWKTGTSSSYRDAWTAGIFGDFVLIVWVGNFDGRPNNAFSGANAAAPIYFALADAVVNYYDGIGVKIIDNNFMRDDLNIINVDMCVIGGGIAGPYCPRVEKSYFIPGKSPITRNTVHRMIPIDNKTGLRACAANGATTHNEIYEFWDTEYLDLFKRAGIKRNTPPKYMPGCDISETADDTVAPVIVYPLADTKIVITSGADSENVGFVGLGATNDAKLIWFLDDKILGTTHNGETLEYRVQMGDHKLSVTDTMGTTTEMHFTVVK